MNPPQGANSPTPRTDAASIDVSYIPEQYCQVVRSAFARQLETEHAQLVSRVASLEGALRIFASQKHTTEMSAEDYEQGDIDFAYDKFIEESRALLSPVPQEGQKK